MSDHVNLKPGCYGSFLAYKIDAPECRSCPYHQLCGPVAVERQAAYRQLLGVSDPNVLAGRAPTRKKPAGDQLANPPLPKKVQELMTRIQNMGISVTESLHNGKNPFESRPVFMKVICHLLLKRDNGVNEKLLTQALMTKLEWTEGTAKAHVGQAKCLLRTLNLIDEHQGRMTLRKL